MVALDDAQVLVAPQGLAWTGGEIEQLTNPLTVAIVCTEGPEHLPDAGARGIELPPRSGRGGRLLRYVFHTQMVAGPADSGRGASGACSTDRWGRGGVAATARTPFRKRRPSVQIVPW